MGPPVSLPAPPLLLARLEGSSHCGTQVRVNVGDDRAALSASEQPPLVAE